MGVKHERELKRIFGSGLKLVQIDNGPIYFGRSSQTPTWASLTLIAYDRDWSRWPLRSCVEQVAYMLGYKVTNELIDELMRKVEAMAIRTKDEARAMGYETAELMVSFLREDVPPANFYKLAQKLSMWDGLTDSTELAYAYIDGCMAVFMAFNNVKQIERNTSKQKEVSYTEKGFV